MGSLTNRQRYKKREQEGLLKSRREKALGGDYGDLKPFTPPRLLPVVYTGGLEHNEDSPSVHPAIHWRFPFYTGAAIRLACVGNACERLKEINLFASAWVYSRLCLSATDCMISFNTFAHVYINLRLTASALCIPLLVLTTTGNRVRRQASAGAGREEAGKLMIPHHRSDKRGGIFPHKSSGSSRETRRRHLC